MSKIVEMENDADGEGKILEERWPKVSRKKEYIDLFDRVRGEVVMKEEIELHPVIRKSIGSIKLAELTIFPQKSSPKVFDVAEEVVEKEICPWDLDVAPTSVEEIMNSWIFERIEEEDTEKIPIERKERVKTWIKHFFQKHFAGKAIKKKIEDKVIEPENNPQVEFEELTRKFTQNKVLCIDREAEEMPGIVVNESMIHTHDLSSKPSTSNLVSQVKVTRSTSVETSGQSKQNSELHIQREDHISSPSERLSREASIDSEKRFRITAVLSDFSLQKQTLFPDKRYF